MASRKQHAQHEKEESVSTDRGDKPAAPAIPQKPDAPAKSGGRAMLIWGSAVLLFVVVFVIKECF
jgi:hypothetical protein